MTVKNDPDRIFALRLEGLHQELAKGQRQLEILDHQRQDLRDTLLRIGGAIQVLEELLEPQRGRPSNGQPAPELAPRSAEPVGA